MDFYIEKTSHTPLMKFNDGILEISGRSIPEDSLELYSPLLDCLAEYVKAPLPVTVVKIFLEYANSSTNRSLMTVFEMMEELHSKGNEVSVNWYYVPDDKEMYDLGSDFKDLLLLPFNIEEMENK
jgi:hypothetical protein